VQNRLARNPATVSSLTVGVTKRRSMISRGYLWVRSMTAFPSDVAFSYSPPCVNPVQSYVHYGRGAS
jgi:hypothetical protein